MDLIKDFLPLLGVLLGAAISGFSQLYKARIERKRSIATALTDLLEVRHHVSGIKEILDALKKKYNLPIEAEAVIYSALEHVCPIDPELHKRYENAVSMLSGYDPFLAFFLRSKSVAPCFLNSVNGLGFSNGIGASTLGELSQIFLNAITPAMDKAVITLASAHGWTTKRRVVAYLKESSRLPPEINSLFTQLEKILDAQKTAHETVN